MRRLVILAVAAAVALIAFAVLRPHPSGPGASDYRDPAQLAEAIKSAHHSAAANCGKLPTGKYFCAVAYTDGASASYTVTVAADGKSYTAN
jgi:hypothetical protein